MDNLENRLAKLEEQCKQINANINSLKTIVNALEDADQITSVSELVENGKNVGYKIEFSKSDPIYIYHGQDGTDGSDGTDGYIPQIGVEKDKDGIYYWTLDGTWLTDKDGNKIKAVGLDGKNGEAGKDGTDGSNGINGSNGSNGRDGVTPKLRINEGNWEVSYNNGVSWEVLGSATGGTTQSPITEVEVKDKYVIFTLSSGNKIQIPLFNGISITFDETEIEMEAGSKIDLTYKLIGSDDVKVSAIGEGVRTSINQKNKTLTITTDTNFEGGKVLVHATDGNNVATVELTITKEVITYIEYEATEKITPKTDAFGGNGIRLLENKSTFSDGKGKWAYKGEVTYVSTFAFGSSFTKNTTLKSIILPESITDIGYDELNPTIGGSAFENCTALESIVIKGNITTIRVKTFYGCSSLKSITLPESLMTIKYNAFLRCKALTEIVIPDAVTTIEKQVFSQCSALKKVTLGTQLESIGENAFNRCLALETVICSDETPATLGPGAFPVSDGWDYTANYKIYVPDVQLDTYRTSWPAYWDSSNPYKKTQVIYAISTMPTE
ncbi:leucine-rich repeat protein [Parabacteroides sp. AD58]|uniref:Leucine-rich repeat protein n=1 Tax=Parabacteroides absconsus TaxID=2951805 RepID=A0ABZ2IMU9_9BACT|nr:leucine-rich repeat protein [Parabacteroides sp. AD58]MCM6902095.1 leucine-rich repeat protein [Parabacteroides sp. AD58]